MAKLEQHRLLIGEFLKPRRKGAGLTQKVAAESASRVSGRLVSDQFISNIERGSDPLPEYLIPVFSNIYGIQEADFINVLLQARKQHIESIYQDSLENQRTSS